MDLDNYNLAWLRSVGRVLLGALFVISGGMILNGGVSGFAAGLTGLGVPAAGIMVWVVLLIKVVGGLMLIVGYHSRIAAAALVLFVIGTIALVHNNAAELGAALKNLSIIGGLLYVIASGPGPYTIVSLMKGNASTEALRQNQNALKAQ